MISALVQFNSEKDLIFFCFPIGDLLLLAHENGGSVHAVAVNQASPLENDFMTIEK